jgi:predicted ATP-grasp superfamily ATP-dependent carboligase
VNRGFNVIALDYFGDRDEKELVENYSLSRDFNLGFSAENLLSVSRRLDFEALVYNSNLENHAEVVKRLAEGHTLIGNTPQTLRQVRHWPMLQTFCHESGIHFPSTLFIGDHQPKEGGRWLLKPIKSGGGHGIAFWSGEALSEEDFLQEYIDGQHCSASLVADGRNCVLIGITEQLIGQEEMGRRGFAWCGNILPLTVAAQETDSIIGAVEDIATKLTRRFGLRGVNGFDFILTSSPQGQHIPYLVEVNPRYTGSMELMEWAYHLNIFNLHIRAFKGDLPSFSLREQLHQSYFYGKGVVYARYNATMPETEGWRERRRRDIPFTAEQIRAGHPICTVFAQGRSHDECWHQLLEEVDTLRREIIERRYKDDVTKIKERAELCKF